MINFFIDGIIYELYKSPNYVPIFTLSIIAIWYIIFLALFDIMGYLYENYTTYLLPRLRRMWGKLAAHLRRMRGECGRALVLWLSKRLRRVDKYKRYYNEEKEEKMTSKKALKKGKWKAFTHSAYHGNDDYGEPIWRNVVIYHCSECNRRTVIKEKYCPNCGAMMDVQ